MTTQNNKEASPEWQEFRKSTERARALFWWKIVENLKRELPGEVERKGIKRVLGELIDAIRAEWIANLPNEESSELQPGEVSLQELERECQQAGIKLPQRNEKMYQLAQRLGLSLENWLHRDFRRNFRFHIPIDAKTRYGPEAYQKLIHTLREIFPEKYGDFSDEQMERMLKNYDLSIRTFNFSSEILNSEAIRYFLPAGETEFVDDPFGVQREEHVVSIQLNKKDKKTGKIKKGWYYLATRKIEHDTYLAILATVGNCTAGCNNCYREQTRTPEGFYIITQTGSKKPVRFLPAVEQVKELVKIWQKEESPPTDILFSGGEPMDIPIINWQEIVNELKKVDSLRSFRICTGDLFLGEPFRLLSPEFVAALKGFYNSTGKKISFAVHLPHPNFITPEAVYTIMKLKKLGLEIAIDSQTPMREGINCFQSKTNRQIQSLLDRAFLSEEEMKTKSHFEQIVDDLVNFGLLDPKYKEELLYTLLLKQKIKDTITRLDDKELIENIAPSFAKSCQGIKELAVKFVSVTNNKPYKLIHDMQQSLSILYSTMVHSLLFLPHVGLSDKYRPTSLAAFLPKVPNLDLNFNTLKLIESNPENRCEERAVLSFKIPAAYQGELDDRLRNFFSQKELSRVGKIEKKKRVKKRLESYVEYSLPFDYNKAEQYSKLLNGLAVENQEIKEKVIFKLEHPIGQLVDYEEPYSGLNDIRILKRIIETNNWCRLRQRVAELMAELEKEKGEELH